MQKKIFTRIYYILLLYIFLAPGFVFGQTSQTQPIFGGGLKTQIKDNVSAFIGRAGLHAFDLPSFVGILIQMLMSILSVFFLLLILYGGYKWMMAKGNEQEVDKAKDVIRNSIYGLIVVLSSYAIAYFILFWLSTAGTGEGMPYTP